MYLYSAFNLSISSEIPIPEFLPTNKNPDIHLNLGSLTPPEINLEGSVRVIGAMGDGIFLHWSDIGSFLVERGDTVIVTPSSGADDAMIRLVLTGPTLGVLLHLRGFRVFHAAVLSAPCCGGAVAFLARKGGGKSTMLGSMCLIGYGLMSDDILAIRSDKDQLIAVPGFPHTKLWKEAASAISPDFQTLTDSVPGFDKQGRFVEDCFYPDPSPLKAVFVLEYGDELRIDKLHAGEALMALLPHWYGAQFDGQLLDIFGKDKHFEQCSELARSVPVYRLTRPRSIDRLGETAAMVDDFLQNPPGGS